jgi:hypothetical protein
MSDTKRLSELLAAYGASPERWPEPEREAARRLVESSAEAAALAKEAAALDRVLDAVTIEPPSLSLAHRVLATAPRRRVRRRWAAFVAVPFAAAAAIVLWLATRQEPASQLAVIPDTIGEYTSPTDVLLEPWGGDAYATLPSVGCADSALGCPKVDGAVQPVSDRGSRRLRA